MLFLKNQAVFFNLRSQFSTSAWESWLIWRIWIVLGLKAKGTLLAVCCVELSILAIQKLTSVKLNSGLGAANSHADTRYIGFDKGHIYRKLNFTWHFLETTFHRYRIVI